MFQRMSSSVRIAGQDWSEKCGLRAKYNRTEGTVEFSSEIAKSLNFTAEHMENAKVPESINNDWNSLKTLRTLRSPR